MRQFLTTIFLAIFAWLIVVTALVIWPVRDDIGASMLAAMFAFGAFLRWLGIIVLVLIGAGGSVFVASRWLHVRDQVRRQRDGAWPLQEHRVWPDGRRPGAIVRAWRWLVGGQAPVHVIVDPNTVVGPGYAIEDGTGVIELEPPAGWETQQRHNNVVQTTRHIQAAQGGEGMGGRMSASMGKLLSGYWQRPPRGQATPEVLPGPVSAPLSLEDAIRESTLDGIILGQSPETGELAVWDPTSQPHLGIVGRSGSGKTAYVGMELVLAWLAAGGQVVILDGKGGMDWSPFRGVAEWHEATPATFLGQVRDVHGEFERRWAILQQRQVRDARTLGDAGMPPLLAVMEEVGVIRSALGGQRAEVDRLLGNLFNLGRAADVHLVLMDQKVRGWSDAMKVNAHWVALALDATQAGAVGEWHAQRLGTGEFIWQGQRYAAWLTAAEAPAILERLGRYARRFPPLLTARTDPFADERSRTFTNASQDTPPSPPTNANGEGEGTQFTGSWVEFVDRFMNRNPDATQADLRRAMAATDPERRHPDAFKGVAHDEWHRWHRERGGEDRG